MKDKNTKQDLAFEKVVNSKLTYIVLLILVVVYLYSDDRILNIPIVFFWSKFFFIIVFFSILLRWRYTKYKSYYVQKIRDKVVVIGSIVVFLIFSMIFQGILNIPLNYIVKNEVKNKLVEVYNCKITNVITTGTDKIHFLFKKKRYSRYFNVNNYEKRELIDDCYLQLKVQKSFWNIYYVNGMEIKQKD